MLNLLNTFKRKKVQKWSQLQKGLTNTNAQEMIQSTFFLNQKYQKPACDLHWLGQTPAFGCSSFSCPSRKSASSWQRWSAFRHELGSVPAAACGKSRLKHKCAFNPWLLPTWKYVELLSIFRWNHVKSTTKSPGQTNQNSDRIFAAGHYSSCIPPSLQCGDTIEFCLKLF